MKEFKFQGISVEVRQETNKDAQLISLDQALKIFKKKLEKDGVLQIFKEKRYYTKPSIIEHERVKKLQRINELKRKINKK